MPLLACNWGNMCGPQRPKNNVVSRACKQLARCLQATAGTAWALGYCQIHCSGKVYCYPGATQQQWQSVDHCPNQPPSTPLSVRNCFLQLLATGVASIDCCLNTLSDQHCEGIPAATAAWVGMLQRLLTLQLLPLLLLLLLLHHGLSGAFS
jgi:hypothetical protein